MAKKQQKPDIATIDSDTRLMNIPAKVWPSMIGDKGTIIREFEKRFGVRARFLGGNKLSYPDGRTIRITGSKDKLSLAVDHITKFVKQKLEIGGESLTLTSKHAKVVIPYQICDENLMEILSILEQRYDFKFQAQSTQGNSSTIHLFGNSNSIEMAKESLNCYIRQRMNAGESLSASEDSLISESDPDQLKENSSKSSFSVSKQSKFSNGQRGIFLSTNLHSGPSFGTSSRRTPGEETSMYSSSSSGEETTRPGSSQLAKSVIPSTAKYRAYLSTASNNKGNHYPGVTSNGVKGQNVSTSLSSMVAEMERENRLLREKVSCVKCRRNERTIVLLPCTHLLFCACCCTLVNVCPSCDQKVSNVVTVLFR